ncbi:MAG: transporter substrate-binding domain-containing protein [Methylocystaceae bacterium]|nr:transporter substrate-binding domain-containing protein [Methylocystaceae bacterium]
MRSLIVLLVFLTFAEKAKADRYDIAVAHIPPYAMMRDTGPEGILVDIVNEAYGRLGHHVRFHFLPWPRAIRYVKLGKVDGIAPFIKSEERTKFVDFFEPALLDMELLFFRKSGSLISASTVEEAHPYHVAKVARVNLGTNFEKFESEELLQVDYVNKTLSGIKVLMNGRVALFASPKLIAEYAAANAGLHNMIEPAGEPFDSLKTFLAFSKNGKGQKIGEQVSQEIAKMHKNGRIEYLMRRYLSHMKF